MSMIEQPPGPSRKVRKTVLIVDDADSICQAVGSTLQIAGYDTLVAHDGAAGVDMALRHRPDVILLDIMMPILDGWGAISRIRGAPEIANTPTIALTALHLSDDQARAAGFDGYLSKPVSPHRLKEEIQAASRSRR